MIGKRREGRTKYFEFVGGGWCRGPDRTSCLVPPEMIRLESRDSWDIGATSVVAGRSLRAPVSVEEEEEESGLSVCRPSSTASSPSDHCENDPAFEGPGSGPSKNGKERAVEGNCLMT